MDKCALDKPTAGKEHQPGCHTQKSRPTDWTFRGYTRNTEATQPIQTLSDTRMAIKINFPGRQHQPTHTKKGGRKGQVGVTAKERKQLLTEGLVHGSTGFSHKRRLVRQEHAAPPRREFRSIGQVGD